MIRVSLVLVEIVSLMLVKYASLIIVMDLRRYIMNWGPQGEGIHSLLYEPFELVTNSRRRVQMILLQALADEYRGSFNKE